MSSPAIQRREPEGAFTFFCVIKIESHADGDAHLQPPGVSAIERQGLGGLCCVRMDAYKLDHGERHPHKSLKTEARADKNLPAAHRRGPGIPPGSRGSHRDPGVN